MFDDECPDTDYGDTSVSFVTKINHIIKVIVQFSNNKNPYGNFQAKQQDGDFAWSSSLQGYILSSFFYGYVITQVIY